MAYNIFTLDMLIQQFGLHVVSEMDVFARATPVAPSALLRETLADSVPLALDISTEKARSEFIIAPVLAEARRHFGGTISLFSGVDFTVDAEVGLGGICDYLFSLSPLQLVVQVPVLAIVEAKNDNIKTGRASASPRCWPPSASTRGAGRNCPASTGPSRPAARGSSCGCTGQT